MSIGHIAVRTHNRGRGHTAAAALAYRAGKRLRDHVGCVHDYRSRARVEAIQRCGVSAPQRWIGRHDLQLLANAIEVAEKRKDSRLLRDFQVALPHELSNDQQIKLVREFSLFLTGRYDTVVAWAVHVPPKGRDRRNIHAHLVVPTRSLNEAGDAFGPKLRFLDCAPTSSQEITQIRNSWADLANAALIQAGKDERVNVGRKSQKGHHRHARARWSKRGFRQGARALLHGFRQLLAVARDDWSVGIRTSIRKYIKIANARARLRAKAPAKIAPSPRAVSIENPPPTLAPGQSKDVSAKGRGLQTAVIKPIRDETPYSALARTSQRATVLLCAQYAEQRVFELKQLADGTITASNTGPIGRVVNGRIALNHKQVGKALARCLGRSSLPIDEFIREMCAALEDDGAQVLHTAMPSGSDADFAPGLAKIFASSRSYPVDTTEEYDAAWAAASLRDTLSPQQAVHKDAPSS